MDIIAAYYYRGCSLAMKLKGRFQRRLFARLVASHSERATQALIQKCVLRSVTKENSLGTRV